MDSDTAEARPRAKSRIDEEGRASSKARPASATFRTARLGHYKGIVRFQPDNPTRISALGGLARRLADNHHRVQGGGGGAELSDSAISSMD